MSPLSQNEPNEAGDDSQERMELLDTVPSVSSKAGLINAAFSGCRVERLRRSRAAALAQ